MISIEIFKLFGSIFVDNDKANKSIAKTDKNAKGLTSSLGKGIKTAAKWTVGLTAGAVAVGGALLGVTNKAAETTDRIDKLSQKIGLSRQGFQEWDFIMSQSGGSVESLQMGFKTLSLRVDELNNGTGKGSQVFKQLGLSIDQVQQMSQEELFENLVVKLQDMEDGTQKAIFANELFGRTGQELMPLLNGQAGSVEELKQKASELGLVLGNDAVDAGVKFTDTMDQFKRSAGALFTQLGIALMPMFQKLLEWVMQQLPVIKETFKLTFDYISSVIRIFIGLVKNMVGWVQNWAVSNEENINNIKDKFSTFIETVKDLFQAFLEDLKEFWDIHKEQFMAMFEAIAEFIRTFIQFTMDIWSKYGKDIVVVLKLAWETIKTIISVATTLITEVFKIFSALFKGDWEGFWSGIKNYFKVIWDGIGAILHDAIELVKKVISLGLNVIKDTFKNIFTGIKELVFNIWEGIVDGIKGFINKIIGAMNKMIRGMNKISFSIPGWVPDIGGKSWGFNLDTIPLLAKGGEIIRKGSVIVGEKGPELLELPLGAKVKPLDRVTNEASSKSTGSIIFDRGAFEGALIMDDYGVDRLMDRVIERMTVLGVS